MNNVNVSGPVQPTATYKTKVLKGNHSFASQVTKPNMKYVIKHDFVLDGDVTIPANCILEFDGGSISGAYTLTGNNTGIEAGLVKIFNTNVTLDGEWSNIINVKWFGAKGDGITDDTVALRKVMEENYPCYIPKGNYKITGTIDAHDTSLKKNTCWIGAETVRNNSKWNVYSTTNIYCYGDNNGNPFLLFPKYVKNLNIIGEQTENKQPKYENSIGVQHGSPYRFMNDSVIENINICGFGIGINIQECAGVRYNNCIFNGNCIGVDLTCEYIQGYDSGYNTTVSFDNCAVSDNKTLGIRKLSNIGGGNTQPGMYQFISGYIEANSTDGTYDTQIYMEVGGLKIDHLYSEANYGYFIRCNYLTILNTDNWWIKKVFVNGHLTIQNSYLPDIDAYCKNSLTLINSEIKNVYSTEDVIDSEGQIIQEGTIGEISIIHSRIHDYSTNEWLTIISVPKIDITTYDESKAFPFLRTNNNVPVCVYNSDTGQHNSLAVLSSDKRLFNAGNGFRLKNNTIGIGSIDKLATDYEGKEYYSLTDHKKIVYVGNSKWMAYDMQILGRSIGTYSQIPTWLAQNDIGYKYFATDIKKQLWCTGGNNWVEADGAKAGVSRSGSIRPLASDIYVGFVFFDTSLSPSRPIFASAINGDTVTWVDATGATV